MDTFKIGGVTINLQSESGADVKIIVLAEKASDEDCRMALQLIMNQQPSEKQSSRHLTGNRITYDSPILMTIVAGAVEKPPLVYKDLFDICTDLQTRIITPSQLQAAMDDITRGQKPDAKWRNQLASNDVIEAFLGTFA